MAVTGELGGVLEVEAIVGELGSAAIDALFSTSADMVWGSASLD